MRAAFENEAKPEQQGSSSDVCRCAGWERHHPFCLSDGQAEPVSIWSSICAVVQSHPQQGSGPKPRETNTVVFYQVFEKSTRPAGSLPLVFAFAQVYSCTLSNQLLQCHNAERICVFFPSSESIWVILETKAVMFSDSESRARLFITASQTSDELCRCVLGSSLTQLYENADVFFSKWWNLGWKRGPGCARCQRENLWVEYNFSSLEIKVREWQLLVWKASKKKIVGCF